MKLASTEKNFMLYKETRCSKSCKDPDFEVYILGVSQSVSDFGNSLMHRSALLA